jgi:hypothetical protein
MKETKMRWKNFGSVALGLAALVVSGAVAFPAAAEESECPARLDAMIAAAYPDAEAGEYGRYRLRDPDRRFHRSSIACGPIPGAAGLMAVLVSIAHDEGSRFIENVGDLEVLVFEDGVAAPLHRIMEERLTSEDAYHVSGIEVDAARYELAGPAPVFGVLMKRENRARYNPSSVSTLRLYRIAEGKLEAILVNLAMRKYRAEWHDSTCEAEKEVTRREVIVGRQGAGGHADLTIVGGMERTVTTGRFEPCKEATEVIREEHVVLTFDGKSYPVPETLRGFDEDYQ